MSGPPRPAVGGKAGLPFPDKDLHSRPLPVGVIRADLSGHRCHKVGLSPIFFGPAGAEPKYRFDDPAGTFKVCYIAAMATGAFVETFLRELPTRTVAIGELEQRAISTVRFTRDVKVCRAYGRHLVQLGATSALGGAKLVGPGVSNPYEHSQAWSRAIFDHPDAVDGIEYRSSHDDTQRCLALFDRATTALADVGDAWIIWNNKGFLAGLLKLYPIELL